jgi:7-cyano-7-deazaguanine synthase
VQLKENKQMSRALVLVSGGLDSATVLALARQEGFDLFALSFDYGQRHRGELDAARRVTAAQGVRQHLLFPMDMRAIGGSALTGAIDVPKSGLEADKIPVTYVPARNTVFLSIALGWAEVLGAHDIFIGVNALDYSGYPDCRPDFIEAFERMANLGTKDGVEGRPFRIRAPLIALTKAEIIRQGLALGVDYGMTHSCYDPIGEKACGRCDSCRLRLRAFAEIGVPDPVAYAVAP